MKRGTLAITWGEPAEPELHICEGLKQLRVGRLTVAWVPVVEIGDLMSAFVAETRDLDSLVENRMAELGVSN